MQSSFFDLENRYTSLSQAGDPLERLDAVSRLGDIQYDPATHRQQTAQKRGVALATDKRDSGGEKRQFLRLDGFALPTYKIGRQTTSRYSPPA